MKKVFIFSLVTMFICICSMPVFTQSSSLSRTGIFYSNADKQNIEGFTPEEKEILEKNSSSFRIMIASPDILELDNPSIFYSKAINTYSNAGKGFYREHQTLVDDTIAEIKDLRASLKETRELNNQYTKVIDEQMGLFEGYSDESALFKAIKEREIESFKLNTVFAIEEASKWAVIEAIQEQLDELEVTDKTPVNESYIKSILYRDLLYLYADLLTFYQIKYRDAVVSSIFNNAAQENPGVKTPEELLKTLKPIHKKELDLLDALLADIGQKFEQLQLINNKLKSVQYLYNDMDKYCLKEFDSIISPLKANLEKVKAKTVSDPETNKALIASIEGYIQYFEEIQNKTKEKILSFEMTEAIRYAKENEGNTLITYNSVMTGTIGADIPYDQKTGTQKFYDYMGFIGTVAHNTGKSIMTAPAAGLNYATGKAFEKMSEVEDKTKAAWKYGIGTREYIDWSDQYNKSSEKINMGNIQDTIIKPVQTTFHKGTTDESLKKSFVPIRTAYATADYGSSKAADMIYGTNNADFHGTVTDPLIAALKGEDYSTIGKEGIKKAEEGYETFENKVAENVPLIPKEATKFGTNVIMNVVTIGGYGIGKDFTDLSSDTKSKGQKVCAGIGLLLTGFSSLEDIGKNVKVSNITEFIENTVKSMDDGLKNLDDYFTNKQLMQNMVNKSKNYVKNLKDTNVNSVKGMKKLIENQNKLTGQMDKIKNIFPKSQNVDDLIKTKMKNNLSNLANTTKKLTKIPYAGKVANPHGWIDTFIDDFIDEVLAKDLFVKKKDNTGKKVTTAKGKGVTDLTKTSTGSSNTTKVTVNQPPANTTTSGTSTKSTKPQGVKTLLKTPGNKNNNFTGKTLLKDKKPDGTKGKQTTTTGQGGKDKTISTSTTTTSKNQGGDNSGSSGDTGDDGTSGSTGTSSTGSIPKSTKIATAQPATKKVPGKQKMGYISQIKVACTEKDATKLVELASKVNFADESKHLYGCLLDIGQEKYDIINGLIDTLKTTRAGNRTSFNVNYKRAYDAENEKNYNNYEILNDCYQENEFQQTDLDKKIGKDLAKLEQLIRDMDRGYLKHCKSYMGGGPTHMTPVWVDKYLRRVDKGLASLNFPESSPPDKLTFDLYCGAEPPVASNNNQPDEDNTDDKDSSEAPDKVASNTTKPAKTDQPVSSNKNNYINKPYPGSSDDTKKTVKTPSDKKSVAKSTTGKSVKKSKVKKPAKIATTKPGSIDTPYPNTTTSSGSGNNNTGDNNYADTPYNNNTVNNTDDDKNNYINKPYPGSTGTEKKIIKTSSGKKSVAKSTTGKSVKKSKVKKPAKIVTSKPGSIDTPYPNTTTSSSSGNNNTGDNNYANAPYDNKTVNNTGDDKNNYINKPYPGSTGTEKKIIKTSSGKKSVAKSTTGKSVKKSKVKKPAKVVSNTHGNMNTPYNSDNNNSSNTGNSSKNSYTNTPYPGTSSTTKKSIKKPSGNKSVAKSTTGKSVKQSKVKKPAKVVTNTPGSMNTPYNSSNNNTYNSNKPLTTKVTSNTSYPKKTYNKPVKTYTSASSFNGTYTGKMTGSYGYGMNGNLTLTVSGNKVYAKANGKYGPNNFTASGNGIFNPSTGRITINMAYGQYGGYKVQGDLEGTVKNNRASGSWSAESYDGTDVGNWTAVKR